MSIELKTAFKAAGGQAAVGRLLGYSRSTVNSWIKRGFPVEHCAPVETATQGVVNRQLMRPDDWQIYWPELAYQAGWRRQPRRQGINGADKSVAC